MPRRTAGLDNWRELGWIPCACPAPNGYAKGRKSMRLGNCCLGWSTCTNGARLCPDCRLAFCQYHGEQHAYRQGTSWHTWITAQPQLHVTVKKVRPTPSNAWKRRMKERTPTGGQKARTAKGDHATP